MNSLDYPPAILELVLHLKTLPSIGTRGAERMALWMLQNNQDKANALAKSIVDTMEAVRHCSECGFFTQGEELCPACADPMRDHKLFCIVEQATDILPIERSSVFQGVYHCLGGKLSPLDDIGPENLNIDSLLARVARETDCEVILATGSDVEGEATATYLTSILRGKGCRVSRLAQGLPAGAGLGHADALTLMKALQGRTEC